MVRALHHGRPTPGTRPFADGVLDGYADVAERALPHTVEIGVATYTRNLDVAPYTPTETWTPDGDPVACLVEPGTGREVDVVRDPSELHRFTVSVPRGTPVPPDRQLRVQDGPAAGVVLTVDRVEASSTQPLVRLSCHRFVPGGP